MNKKLYWSLRIILGIIGLIALYQVVPYLIGLLRAIVYLINNTEMSSEFQLIVLFITVWLSCSVFNTIANILSKLHLLLEDKMKKKSKLK